MASNVEKSTITTPAKKRPAKGRPGVSPRWTSGAKTTIGTAVPDQSRVWFTVNNGAIAEIYHPDVDTANTRVVRFLITGEDGFFSDEIWDADHEVRWLESGVPGCFIETKCKQGRYTLRKEMITDPVRDVLMLRVEFLPGPGQHLHLYVSMDPHVADQGKDNIAWAGEFKGLPMLLACRDHVNLAMAAKPDLRGMSVGYIGATDAYTLLREGKPLPEANWAEPGNVGVAAEIEYEAAPKTENGASLFHLAIGFGSSPAEAAQQARAGLLESFDKTRALFVQLWQEEQSRYLPIDDLSENALDLYRVSVATMEAHQSKRFPGGFVASLSLPWGFVRGDKDEGGYHVVWPRDLSEAAMGKLACGDAATARSSLFYLGCTQAADGGWSQNMWLDGTPHWTAIQMDGIALPILLADKLRRDDALDGYDPRPMVHEAARYVLKHGPVTGQDRWEALPGYSPYTMAVQVAALLASADCADQRGRADQAEFLRQTADAWNDAIDELTYVHGTKLARKHDVSGYYLRMSPPERIERKETRGMSVQMSNLPFGLRHQLATKIVSPDALALVRFGLRAADDPRIVNTVEVVDAELRRETRTGATWRRSSMDGYGENAKGEPYLKTGMGHGWPLLAGERGHFELAAGRRDAALELLKTMGRQTSECGMIPEQIWDEPDIAERELYNGRPTGSGMPLVWAHAEYVKLLRSLHEGAMWDRIPQTYARYVETRHPASFQIWRPEQRRRYVAEGKDLRIDLDDAARVSWRVNGRTFEAATTDSELGLHTVLLPLRDVGEGCAVKIVVESQEKEASFRGGSLVVHVHRSDA